MIFRFKNIVGLLSILSLSLSTSHTYAQIWPGDKWEISTPEKEGVDPEVINTIISDLDAGVYGLVDHFFLVRNGKVIADHELMYDYKAIIEKDGDKHLHAGSVEGDHQYNYDHTDWHPFYKGTNLHTLQSVTKSVTSAVLGIAIDEGLIKDVNVPVSTFFKDYKYDLSDSRKSLITLEDFLTMRSGIDWVTPGGYNDPEHSTNKLEASNKWIQFVLDRPMDRLPGTFFQYNDGVSVLLGKIVRQVTGQRIDMWANEKLFSQIGIKDFHWKITPDGEADTEGGLYLASHDLARVGYLFLHEGNWNGKQVISKEWAKASVQPVVADVAPNNPKFKIGYGYQWWVPSYGEGKATIFAGNGYGGQFVMIAPEYDIVVVFNGWSLHARPQKSAYAVLQSVIIPAITDR